MKTTIKKLIAVLLILISIPFTTAYAGTKTDNNLTDDLIISLKSPSLTMKDKKEFICDYAKKNKRTIEEQKKLDEERKKIEEKYPCSTGQSPKWMIEMTNEENILDILTNPLTPDWAKEQLAEKLLLEIDELDFSQIVPQAAASQMLDVKPIRQLQKDWCAAATVQQTLTYINKTSPSQSSIVNGGVGVGPGLQTTLDYINSKQNRNSYIRSVFKNESAWLTRLNYLYNANAPGVFTLKATKADVNNYLWEYETNGHFVSVMGWLDFNTGNPAIDKIYFFADPYNFPQYGFSDGEGGGLAIFSTVLKLSERLQGAGNATIGY